MRSLNIDYSYKNDQTGLWQGDGLGPIYNLALEKGLKNNNT